jgi:hypothetical protein
MPRRLALAALPALVLGAAALLGAAAPPAHAPPAAAPRRAATCGRCHAAIFADWQASFHARSTAETNPLYRALLGRARGVLGEQADAACSRCHTPAAADGSGTATEGVTCVVCHLVPAGHPDERLPGGRRTRLAGGGDGPGGATATCLVCHDVLASPEGHPVCSTGPEARAAGAGDCVDCHMPERKGPPVAGADARSHAGHGFPASRSPEVLREAATLTLSFGEGAGGRTVDVTVTAGEVGHAVPTGAPLRSLVLTVSALDADGKELWRNHAGEPLTQAPEALFQHVLSDAQGNRPVPAFLAHGPGDDRRLAPGTPRLVRYPLPAGAGTVRAVLTYHLAPAPLLAAAEAPPEWSTPVVVAAAEGRP